MHGNYTEFIDWQLLKLKAVLEEMTLVANDLLNRKELYLNKQQKN